jgi:hypothetical protein
MNYMTTYTRWGQSGDSKRNQEHNNLHLNIEDFDQPIIFLLFLQANLNLFIDSKWQITESALEYYLEKDATAKTQQNAFRV